VFYGLSSGVGGVIGALLAGQPWRFGGQVAFAAGGFLALASCGVAWQWLLRRQPRDVPENA
jgi:PPP family 3-phenylpropionic acid transporter